MVDLDVPAKTALIPTMGFSPLSTNTQHLNWNLPDILPGQSANLIYSTTAPTPLEIDSYTNTATLTYDHWTIETISSVYKSDPSGDPGPNPTPDTENQTWLLILILSTLIPGYLLLIRIKKRTK